MKPQSNVTGEMTVSCSRDMPCNKSRDQNGVGEASTIDRFDNTTKMKVDESTNL